MAVHGHRGSAAFPENTLPGFLHAIEAGADYVELDIVATADDVLVVCHDTVLKRRIFRGPGGAPAVRALTASELRQWRVAPAARFFRRGPPALEAPIPTLDEVLDLAPRGAFGFNIEVKSDPAHPLLTPPPGRYAELTVAAIRARGLGNRVIVQSFDFRVLEAVRRLDPALPLSALCPRAARDFTAVARTAGVSIVGPSYRRVTRARVEEAHAAGVSVVPWTANRPRDWRRLLAAGVDGIITDHPAELIQFLLLYR